MPINSPKDITEGYIETSKVKASSPAWRLLLLAFFAGVLIGMGAVASSTVANGIPDAGVAKLVTGAVFPIGLMMVVLLGTELFTGNALMVTAAIAGEIKWSHLLRNWGIVYVGNFLGAALVAFLMAFFGQFELGQGALGAYTIKIAAAKCALPIPNSFVLAIFCNLLVCVAIYLGNTAHDTSGKILGTFFPIFGFVIAGFEHCVANMYYIPAGIFAAMNTGYAELAMSAGVNVSLLESIWPFLTNLIPVTLGNIVGGVFVGLAMYAAHVCVGKNAKSKRVKNNG